MATIKSKKSKKSQFQEVDISINIRTTTTSDQIFGEDWAEENYGNLYTSEQIAKMLVDVTEVSGQDPYWYLYDAGLLETDDDLVSWSIDITTEYTGKRENPRPVARSAVREKTCYCGDSAGANGSCGPSGCMNVPA